MRPGDEIYEDLRTDFKSGRNKEANFLLWSCMTKSRTSRFYTGAERACDRVKILVANRAVGYFLVATFLIGVRAQAPAMIGSAQ